MWGKVIQDISGHPWMIHGWKGEEGRNKDQEYICKHGCWEDSMNALLYRLTTHRLSKREIKNLIMESKQLVYRMYCVLITKYQSWL